ncbi:MAG: agmatinase [Granulosicoccus sp.]
MHPVFLDSELSDAEREQSSARFTIIPMPIERTVSYGTGTRHGPAAIIEASNQLERLCGNTEPCTAGIHTEAPIDCNGPLPEVMQRLAKRTYNAVMQQKIPVTLGGEHSLTYGAVKGIQRALDQSNSSGNSDIGIIQIDAHADLRDAYQEEPHSHASVMHLLASEGIRLAQFGVRALCTEEVAQRSRYKVFHVDAEKLVTESIHAVDLPEDFPGNIYVSFDLDGLDPSEMPATGTPVPGGLSFYQSLNLVKHGLKGRRLVGFDVVELAPADGWPGWNFTAAQITYCLMGLSATRQASP